MKKISYPDTPLTRKMHAQGWETVEQFYHHSSVNKVVSRETCRQLILKSKKVIEPVFIKITEALGFSPDQIKDLLKEYGYTDFAHLIGNHNGIQLDDQEKAILSIFRKIENKNPVIKVSVVNFLESICCAASVDCFDELSRLRKKESQ